MKFADGTHLKLGDRVRLSNGENATIVIFFLNDSFVLGPDPEHPPTGAPGVVVVTDNGAQVVFADPDEHDFVRSTE